MLQKRNSTTSSTGPSCSGSPLPGPALLHKPGDPWTWHPAPHWDNREGHRLGKSFLAWGRPSVAQELAS